MIDGEARRLVGWQAREPRFAFSIQPHIWTDFLLLTQCPLTLLLTQQFLLLALLVLRGGLGDLGRRHSGRDDKTAGQPFLQQFW